MHSTFGVFHSPGPNGQNGVDFREQPGIIVHVQHYAKLREQGRFLHGGPFVDTDIGGMMIATDEVSREELEQFAGQDPAGKVGLLKCDVKNLVHGYESYLKEII